VTLDLSSVFNLDGLLDRLIDKNISKVYLLLSQVCLWSQSLTLEFERKSLLSTRYIAKSNAFVGVGLSRAKCHGDGDLAVGPDLSNQGFNLEDIILEKKKIIFDSLSDCFVFPSKS